MTKQLKVYGICYDGRNRMVIAATSLKRAAGVSGISYSFFRRYGSQTWNKEECEQCLPNPEKPFRRSMNAFGADPFNEYKIGERNAD